MVRFQLRPPKARIEGRKVEGSKVEDEVAADFRSFDLRSLDPSVFARVAQLTERWSYKPEVEGLSPSLGTRSKDEGGRMKAASTADIAELHRLQPSCFMPSDLSGRDSSRQNADCPGAWSSKRRVGLTPRPQSKDEVERLKAEGIEGRHRTQQTSASFDPSAFGLCLGACSSAESERLSSKQNVAGSSPARPANSLRSSSSWKERSSHKRKGAGSNPASATKSSHEVQMQGPSAERSEIETRTWNSRLETPRDSRRCDSETRSHSPGL